MFYFVHKVVLLEQLILGGKEVALIHFAFFTTTFNSGTFLAAVRQAGFYGGSTAMNILAHATREAERNSAKLLDKVVGMN